MEPKPIDSRHLLDIDAMQRTVDMGGIPHLRRVSDHKEHPAETDYDIIHDEESRRNREEAARQFIERLKRVRAKRKTEPTEEEAPEVQKRPPNGQKGSHLDIEA